MKKLGPCDNCPFRSDVPAYIHPERGEEIWDSLERGTMFPCHKTVDYDSGDGDGRTTADSKFCAGALILMEKEWAGDGRYGAMENQMVRILTRLRNPPMLDLDALDLSAPGFDDYESWYDYLCEGN